MNGRRSLHPALAAVVTAAATALVAAAVAGAVPQRADRGAGPATPAQMGPGMMGGAFGFGGGGAGPRGLAKPSAAQLDRVRDRIESWLASTGFRGFTVAEVMAFTNSDYVAVRDANGRPAFELLTDLRTRWVMAEPPSMMWNERFGVGSALARRIGPMMGGWMMGGWHGWYGSGAGKVETAAKAAAIADRWLARAGLRERVAPLERNGAENTYPGYYTFDTVIAGKPQGMLSVNARTGAVWYHAWHGTFLAERSFQVGG